MKRFSYFFKRNLYFMISIITVSVAVVFAIVMMSVFDLANEVEETSVGFIYLGNYEPNQYESILNQRVLLWKNSADYKIIYQNYEYSIDMSWFDFDAEETISNIIANENNRAFFTLSTENDLQLSNDLEDTFTSSIINQFEYQLFVDDLLQDISALKNRKVYQLTEYLDETVSLHIIFESTISSIDSIDVNTIINEVTEIEIIENTRFSLLDYFGHTALDNNQLSIIASAMQKLMIETHFTGFVFEQNTDMPSWAELGANVRILKVNQFDFSFFNGLDLHYKITLEKLNDSTIEFKLLGYPYITEYESHHNIEVIIPYQTEIKNNDAINETTPGVSVTETDTEYIYEVVTQVGVDGYIVFFYRTITQYQQSPSILTLYNQQFVPTTKIIEQNIVEKAGG